MGNMENGFQENVFVFLMVIGILVMLAFALAFILYVNFSQKKILTEQMRNQKQAYQHQEALLHSTILVQEEERKRIAKDLHDEIGSKLNIIFLNVHRLKEFDLKREEIEAISDEVEILINTTIDTTRRISHDLLPPTLEDFGLIEAIKELQYNFNQLGTVFIEFDLVENEKKINDKLIELNFYRVLQELINNSIRHGKATELSIKLWIKTAMIKLEYKDNGSGFDQNDNKNKKGLGMKNIESRLRMIHATFQYDTALGKGMKMLIELIQK